jgi:hypothetical protein
MVVDTTRVVTVSSGYVNPFSNSWHTASNAAASASLPWQTTSYAAQLVLATAGAVAPAVEQLELEPAEGAVAEEPGAAELEAGAGGAAVMAATGGNSDTRASNTEIIRTRMSYIPSTVDGADQPLPFKIDNLNLALSVIWPIGAPGSGSCVLRPCG